ncbi:MAG: hypothetical protein AVDCRST_MAG13-1478, partial [uncultured Solirubrobacteraceae bacterium]
DHARSHRRPRPRPRRDRGGLLAAAPLAQARRGPRAQREDRGRPDPAARDGGDGRLRHRRPQRLRRRLHRRGPARQGGPGGRRRPLAAVPARERRGQREGELP